jgi:hypothetical protein
MNTVELTQYALGNAFGILDQVTGDLTQDLADLPAPGIANPIGATYWHAVSGADEVAHRWVQGQAPLFEQDGWREKVLTVPAPEPTVGSGDYLTYMRTIRVDLPALHAYSQAVAGALQAWLALLTPDDLDRTLNTPIGESSMVQVLEVFVIWHINAHCGEIAALKGCQGVKGYPF